MSYSSQDRSITDIDGVFANGIHSGIKADPLKKDLAYIFVPRAFACAGVFTRNQFAASSVTYTKKFLKKGAIKAVIVNSGNANAGTGLQGVKDTKSMARAAAAALGVLPSQVAVASTGKIGQAMPMDTVLSGISDLLSNPKAQDGHAAAEAIMTTDLVRKEVYFEQQVGKRKIVVAGMTKGSGMISPNMATTLTFLVTNVAIEQTALQKRLQDAVDASYNMLSVDTDTSTNDMLLLFSEGSDKDILSLREEWIVFDALLHKACVALAKMIARDGEGATKLIEVQVDGALSGGDARTVAMNVVNSPLVKTALHGADPNWGRIVAAACRDPRLRINANKLRLSFGEFDIFMNGEPVDFDHKRVVDYLKKDEIIVRLDLCLGECSTTAWGCDLTHGYVDINTQYC